MTSVRSKAAGALVAVFTSVPVLLLSAAVLDSLLLLVASFAVFGCFGYYLDTLKCEECRWPIFRRAPATSWLKSKERDGLLVPRTCGKCGQPLD